MNQYAHITGWGLAVPEKIMTNDDLAQIVDTSNEWIVSRTGIRQRHVAEEHQSCATLATDAALKAIEMANIAPQDIDLIIVSTSSPEHLFPATACLVQDNIGASKAGAFDLSAACSGFIYAMNMASQAIKTGSISCAVVIGSETLSRLVNWQDRNTCILFGDGAGAFVLQASEEPGGVLSAVMRSDGSGRDSLSVPAGGSLIPTSAETVAHGLHFVQMNGREVFRFATRVMSQATQEAVEMAKLKMDDIALIVPHQANLRIIEAAARGLEVPMERVMVNVDRYGNTSTASIPIAAVEAANSGRLKQGDYVVFVGFGAGLTWGAAAVRWGVPFPTKRRMPPVSFRIWARLRSLIRRMLRQIEGVIWGRYS